MAKFKLKGDSIYPVYQLRGKVYREGDRITASVVDLDGNVYWNDRGFSVTRPGALQEMYDEAAWHLFILREAVSLNAVLHSWDWVPYNRREA